MTDYCAGCGREKRIYGEGVYTDVGWVCSHKCYEKVRARKRWLE